MNTLINEFLKQAERHPKHIAVLDIRGAYTYRQLNQRSAFLAEKTLKPWEKKNKREESPCCSPGRRNT